MNPAGWFIRQFITPVFAVVAVSVALQAEGTKTLVRGDGMPNRLNMVFLAEGYTKTQQARFLTDVRKDMDSIFSCQPWSNFENAINVYAISVVSEDSGCGNFQDSIYPDTYFGAYYSYGASMTAKNTSKVLALLKEHVPEYDCVCMLVNDPGYGGIGANYLGPGVATGYSIATMDDLSAFIVMHETAHSFVWLSDEYYKSGSACTSERLNITTKSRRDQIRWNAWIAESTPIPTPDDPQYAGVAGLFEGAECDAGSYRPGYGCLMRTIEHGSVFCPVCREELIVGICKAISLADAFSPPNDAPVELRPGAALTVRPVALDSFRLATQWIVNGTILTTASDTLRLADAGLIAGVNTVIARVIDSSGMVRIPENRQLVMDSVVWLVDNGAVAAVTAHPPAQEPLCIIRRSGGVERILIGDCGVYTLQLFDTRGRCVRNFTGPGREVTLGGLGSGCFTYRLILDERPAASGVIICR